MSNDDDDDDDVATATRKIMRALFYAVFDETGGGVTDTSGDEAAGFLVDIPNRGVGDILCKALGVVSMTGRVMLLSGNRLKLEAQAPDLTTTQTQIMQYFAHEATKNPGAAIACRLPGSGWQAPADKPAEQYTIRELMFAGSYGKLIEPAERLKRVVEEASLYE